MRFIKIKHEKYFLLMKILAYKKIIKRKISFFMEIFKKKEEK